MAAVQQSTTVVLNKRQTKLLDTMMNCYMKDPYGHHPRTVIYTQRVAAWKASKPVSGIFISRPPFEITQGDGVFEAILRYFSQHAQGQVVHPFVIVAGDEVDLLITADWRQALKINPAKRYVRELFRLQPASSSGSETSSDEGNEEASNSDGSSSSGYNASVSDGSSPGHSRSPSLSPDHNFTRFLENIAQRFVARDEEHTDAVMIFTVADSISGEKWKTNADRPAIIISAELLPSNSRISRIMNVENSADVMIMNLAQMIARLEGVEPFVSCVDFGSNENGRELDFVVSRHVHEAPLYLHDCHLLPSQQQSTPTISVPAHYHHHSSSSALSSFETELFVGCSREEDNVDPSPVTYCHLTINEDTVESIATRLGRCMRQNLNVKLYLFLRRLEEDAQCQAVMFTNNADLRPTDKNLVIITSEPLPPIPLRGYDHEDDDIAEDITIYLIGRARFKKRKDINVTYLQFRKRYVTYEAHLVLTKSSFVISRDFLERVWDLDRPFTSQVEPLHCLWGRLLPSQVEPPDKLSSPSAPPWIFITETVLWVERPITSIEPNKVYRIPLVSNLDQTLTANVTRKMKSFQRRLKNEDVEAVIFTKDKTMWRPGKDWLIDTDEPLSVGLPKNYEERSDIVNEIGHYILRWANWARVGPLSVSCLRVERKQRVDLHIVLSRSDKPALIHLENCTLTSEPDGGSARTEPVLSEGNYCYFLPHSKYFSPKIHMRVKRKREVTLAAGFTRI